MMDYWILRQLRAKVLGDILEFIPEGYFEDVPEKLKLNPNIPNSKHFSRELGWGYLGGDLGRRLFFESVAIMTARQVSASEVLMNLGMLASTNAVRDVCREISKMALENGVSDRNAGSIAMQMEIQHIPVSESNVKHALGRYFLHLDDKEVVPYLSLLDGFVANAKKDDSKSAAENLGATDSQKSLISILPKGGRVLGVVVGLEHYQDRPTGRNLKKVEYARNDAMGIATVIRSMYPGETVDLSICVDSEASLSNLEYEIKMAIRSISDDDLFVFYYAGHGFHGGGENYLTAWDSRIENLAETSIGLRKVLLDPLSNAKCKRAIIFIDACAENVGDEVFSRNLLRDIDSSVLRNFLSDAVYQATFLSCSPGEKSYSKEGSMHGAWTYFLLKALKGKAPEALGPGLYLTDVGLRDYLGASMRNYSRSQEAQKRVQTPISYVSATNTFIICDVGAMNGLLLEG